MYSHFQHCPMGKAISCLHVIDLYFILFCPTLKRLLEGEWWGNFGFSLMYRKNYLQTLVYINRNKLLFPCTMRDYPSLLFLGLFQSHPILEFSLRNWHVAGQHRGEQVSVQAMNSGLSPLTQNYTTFVMRKLDQPFPKSVRVSPPSPPGET